jgi:hypothetical protein
MLLARACRDNGRHDEALALYEQILGEDPLDRRAREGLLIAAAGSRDAVQLEQAWQQVRASLGGEADVDARSLYEQLRRQVNGVGSLGSVGAGCGGCRSLSRKTSATTPRPVKRTDDMVRRVHKHDPPMTRVPQTPLRTDRPMCALARSSLLVHLLEFEHA